jgi:Ca-activated chloride channel family protein
MEQSSALEIAKAELLGSLDRLPPDTRFAVVFYNLDPERVVAEDGGLLNATSANKERIRTLSRALKPYGGTDHVAALRAGLRLKPEVIYFLTDGQRMSPDDVARLIAEAGGRTRIQAIEFGQGPALGASANLERLAQGTGGAYRYLDVAKLRMDRNARANP